MKKEILKFLRQLFVKQKKELPLGVEAAGLDIKAEKIAKELSDAGYQGPINLDFVKRIEQALKPTYTKVWPKTKTSGEVLDMTGKKIQPGETIVGGKGIEQRIDKIQDIADQLAKLQKEKSAMYGKKPTEAQIKTKLEGMNKKTVASIKARNLFATEKEFASELESLRLNIIRNDPQFNLEIAERYKLPGEKTYTAFPDKEPGKLLSPTQRQKLLDQIKGVMKHDEYKTQFGEDFDFTEITDDLFRIDKAYGGIAGMLGEPTYADGGRTGFKGKKFDLSKRKFLKTSGGLIALLATLPGIGKIFKPFKALTKSKVLTQVPITQIKGMPDWYPLLANQIIKKGKQIESGAERVIVHEAKLPGSKTKMHLTQELDTGNVMVDIGAGKHGWADGHLGQPVRLEYKAAEDIMSGPSDELFKIGVRDPLLRVKSSVHEDLLGGGKLKVGKSKQALEESEFYKKKGLSLKPGKTKEEFWVEEAEFTGGHPENVKFEETVSEKFGEHGSDFSEVEEFATGLKKGKGGSGHMASGGRVPMFAGLIAKGGQKLGKFSKTDVLIQMFENTIKQSKSANTKKRFSNFIKEMKKNPELANDPKVWNFFTKGLPENQRLVVHSDDTVDFWKQSDFGPHNIETTTKFHEKHPYLTRDQAVKIQNMEPEDQILEMKRLETIRNRTKQATGGRVSLSAGGVAGMLGE